MQRHGGRTGGKTHTASSVEWEKHTYAQSHTTHIISRKQQQQQVLLHCIWATAFFLDIHNYCQWFRGCVCVCVWYGGYIYYSCTERLIQFIQLNYYTIYTRTTSQAYLWLRWNNWNEWDSSRFESCEQQQWTLPIVTSFRHIGFCEPIFLLLFSHYVAGETLLAEYISYDRADDRHIFVLVLSFCCVML